MVKKEYTYKEMKEKIDRGIRDQFVFPEYEPIEPTATFEDTFGADSLDAICVVLNLETEFMINIDDEDIGPIKTVQDVYDYISKRITIKKESNNEQEN